VWKSLLLWLDKVLGLLQADDGAFLRIIALEHLSVGDFCVANDSRFLSWVPAGSRPRVV